MRCEYGRHRSPNRSTSRYIMFHNMHDHADAHGIAKGTRGNSAVGRTINLFKVAAAEDLPSRFWGIVACDNLFIGLLIMKT